jgi:hypothetical protein
MSADKLGRFVTSGEFLKRANSAITQAVRELKENGIKPAYVIRPSGTAGEPAIKGTVDKAADDTAT